MIRMPKYCVIWLSFAMVVCGCGKSRYRLAPAHGRVTVAGKPIADGKVVFAPIANHDATDAGKPAYGMIQPDSTFTMTTFDESDGAIVGEHWVSVYVPKELPSAAATAPVDRADLELKRVGFPVKKAVVAGEDNHFEIHL